MAQRERRRARKVGARRLQPWRERGAWRCQCGSFLSFLNNVWLIQSGKGGREGRAPPPAGDGDVEGAGPSGSIRILQLGLGEKAGVMAMGTGQRPGPADRVRRWVTPDVTCDRNEQWLVLFCCSCSLLACIVGMESVAFSESNC